MGLLKNLLKKWLVPQEAVLVRVREQVAWDQLDGLRLAEFLKSETGIKLSAVFNNQQLDFYREIATAPEARRSECAATARAYETIIYHLKLLSSCITDRDSGQFSGPVLGPEDLNDEQKEAALQRMVDGERFDAVEMLGTRGQR